MNHLTKKPIPSDTVIQSNTAFCLCICWTFSLRSHVASWPKLNRSTRLMQASKFSALSGSRTSTATRGISLPLVFYTSVSILIVPTISECVSFKKRQKKREWMLNVCPWDSCAGEMCFLQRFCTRSALRCHGEEEAERTSLCALCKVYSVQPPSLDISVESVGGPFVLLYPVVFFTFRLQEWELMLQRASKPLLSWTTAA